MRNVVVALGLLIASTSSCASVVDEPTSPGTARLHWTVEQGEDPLVCDYYDARSVDITVYDPYRRAIARVQPGCGVFSVDVELWPGKYTAAMHMIDSNGGARTPTMAVPAFDVPSAGLINVSAEFQGNTFYPPNNQE